MITYTIKYQLGAVGKTYLQPASAAKALASAIKAARAGGDQQAIWAERDDGEIFGLDRDHTGVPVLHLLP